MVIYKHPEDSKIFGQYTFKDERCLYETVYYYVSKGRYEFTSEWKFFKKSNACWQQLFDITDPYVTDETNFNITNKINFVKNGAGYEIEYNINPRGLGIFQNLGQEAEIKILPKPLIKKTPAPDTREISPRFNNLGKQNLKV